MLVSCSDDLDDEIKFLKSLVETSDVGSAKTTNFIYNGPLLTTIEDDNIVKTFTYSSDLITEITTTNKSTKEKKIVDYTYENGKLKTVKSAGDYSINYTHNSDGTVSYEKFDISMIIVGFMIQHGVLYFKNGNLTKEERFIDTVGVGVLSKYIVYYEYDSKNNPFYNIVGYDKLLDQEGVVSSNNYIISTVETTVETSDQIISAASFFKNTFKYNALNYPIEKSSLVSIPNKGISYNLKTTYKY